MDVYCPWRIGKDAVDLVMLPLNTMNWVQQKHIWLCKDCHLLLLFSNLYLKLFFFTPKLILVLLFMLFLLAVDVSVNGPRLWHSFLLLCLSHVASIEVRIQYFFISFPVSCALRIGEDRDFGSTLMYYLPFSCNMLWLCDFLQTARRTIYKFSSQFSALIKYVNLSAGNLWSRW